MPKKRPEHDPHHVAAIAASLLQGPRQETHHIKHAVLSARAILDEAHGWDPGADAEEDEPVAELDPEPEAEAEAGEKPAKGGRRAKA